MDQKELFGYPERAPGTDQGNVFGSRFETSTSSANLFGSQSNNNPFNVSETFPGQTSQAAPFGSFVGQPSKASPLGLLTGFGAKSSSADVFGHSSNLQSFSGTSSAGVPVFSGHVNSTGAPIFGGQTVSSGILSAFGEQGLSSGSPSTCVSVFGGQGLSSGTSAGMSVFGGQGISSGTSGGASVFGGQTNNSSAGSSLSVVGKNVVFGSPSADRHNEQPVHSRPGTNLPVFGSAVSLSGSNPFGSSKQSAGFDLHSSSQSNLFASSSSSISFGAIQSINSNPITNQTQSSNVPANSFSTSMTASSFPTKSSNLFGSFPISSVGLVSATAPQLMGVRKRNASGVAGESALFGKQDTKVSALFGAATSSLPTSQFSLAQSSPFTSVASLFAGSQSSVLFSGVTSSARSQQGENEQLLFGRPQAESKPERDIELLQAVKHVGNEHNRHFASTGLKGELPLSNTAMFESNDSASSIQRPTETTLAAVDPSQKKPIGSLFGKPRLPAATKLPEGNQGLFGKGQGFLTQNLSKSQGLSRTASSFNLAEQDSVSESSVKEKYGEGGEREEKRKDVKHSVASPLKSLSKWSQRRDSSQSQLDRKRRDLVLSESQREVKKAKASEDNKAAASPMIRARSSSTRMSQDDLASKNSIVVRDIPAHFNKGPLLRRHFSRFGAITRLQLFATKRAANITFETHEAAAAAKSEGKYLASGSPPVQIFWRSNSKTKSPDEKWTQESQRRPQRRTAVLSAVEDELASMSELHPDFQEVSAVSTSQKQHEVRKALAVRKRSPTPPAPAPQILDADLAKGFFKSIYQARAKDTPERITILDNRDKLLKLLRGRQQSDLATAKAFVGTCPDMCPEKERYYREDIRRLAVYEVLPGTMTSLTGLKSKVDHHRAVKEYSRSSADQEEPLPHELRPLPVLVTTMNYLLTHVANSGGDDTWAEWYDFLWNRTRGIRKDITQQQLCGIEVAELLEKCSRFHIFCSERLCEEDMMSFDAKINSENLTKCHQTLKELYADLEKRGVFCPNEAEFRAYMVLMNLNEGDILREIQQLRPEIRDSPHISFAVQVCNALSANNYVRFFRLIEEKATFLSACILHRYFNQIRSKALLIIMKAHGALGKNVVSYPIEEMIRLLCFENATEVDAFCGHYGISLSGMDVMLDSKAYLEPEGSLPQTRSQSLIEIKQENVSIGEIINGGPLAPLLLSNPLSSFDEDGLFIMSSDVQEALEASKLFRPKAQPQEEVKVQQRDKYSNEAVKSVARIVILEVIDANIAEIASDVMTEESVVAAFAISKVEDMIKATLEISLREIAQEVFAEEEAMLKKQLAEEMAARQQRVYAALCGELVDDAATVMAKELAAEEMKVVKSELLKLQKERCSILCTDDLLGQVLDEMTEDVAVEVFEVDVVMKRERLEATENLVEIIRCRRFLQFWRVKYLAQIKVKRAMLDFPSAPSFSSLSKQIQKLMPVRPHNRISDNSFYIGERSRLSIDSPMDVIQQQLHLNVHLSMASARHMLANLVLWRPLDLLQTVGPQLARSFLRWKTEGLTEPEICSLQWKLIVSVPRFESSSPVEEKTFTRWIRSKLCQHTNRENLLSKTPNYEGEILTQCHTHETSRKQPGRSIGICARCFHGLWNDDQEISIKKGDLLKGASAVMFVLPRAEALHSWNHSQQNTLWNKEKHRLHQTLKQKPSDPAIPLIVIIPRMLSSSSISVAVLDDMLELSMLHKKNLLSVVHVVQPFIGDQELPLKYSQDWTLQLTSWLRFAASHVPAPPRLQLKPVADYVEDAVVEFYKTSVYQDLRSRTRLQMLHQSPNKLLALYNNVIEHIAMVCASSSLTQLSWPAPDFDKTMKGEPKSVWNTEAHLCDLYELVTKMRLPYFRYSDMEAEDWPTVCRDVWSYVALVTKGDSGAAKTHLYQQVAELLSCTRKLFDQFCWLANNCGPCEPAYVNMAWTDLIDACIHYKLASLRRGHISIQKDEEDEKEAEEGLETEEVVVYYQESEFNDWDPPMSWLDALRDTETAEAGQLRLTVDKAADVSRNNNVTDVTEHSSLGEAATSTPSFSTIAGDWMDTTAETPKYETSRLNSLKKLLEEEKIASEKYEKALESSLLCSSSLSEAESRRSDLNLGPFMSPIYSSKKTRSEHLIFPGDEFSFLSGPKQDVGFESWHHTLKTKSQHSFTQSARNSRRSSISAAGRKSPLSSHLNNSFELSSTLSD